ncbi:hypothetical protein NKI74_34325 [Mesorhizobium sp. M0494]|uniref:hypothetical protein n=1 Tax=Mesorhizobium sp. M0494 TaxID=2956951 RepID=UPI00333B52FB
MFVYNTGARATEIIGLTVDQLGLTSSPRANLHGKGDKWRTWPLWPETARLLGEILRWATPASHAGKSGLSGIPCAGRLLNIMVSDVPTAPFGDRREGRCSEPLRASTHDDFRAYA